jgi:hypothetical protein
MEENAKYICELFKSDKPFLIGRNGTIELQMLLKYLQNVPFSQSEINQLELNAGIFPSDSFIDFFNLYVLSLKSADAMAEGWYEPLKIIEKDILDICNKNRTKLLLRNLEPYYVKPELRWTQHLAGKRVAVINSFAEICETQTYMSKAIWGEEAETLLPNSTIWIPIQTYYSPRLANGRAEWPRFIKNWSDAVDNIVQRVLQECCDIAIIGCGGIGMIIGHRLKEKGLQCIVMGGATQILFGIRGKRWETHNVISKFFNDAWVVAPEHCKPANYKLIENGCYW